MPPIGYASYERGDVAVPEVLSKKISLASTMQIIEYDLREQRAEEKGLFRSAMKSRLESPKVYYESEDLEPGQLVAAWLSIQRGAQAPVCLYTQVVEVRGEEKVGVLGPDLRLETDNEYSVKIIDSVARYRNGQSLTEQGELDFINDAIATVDLIREEVPRLMGRPSRNV